MSSHPPTSNAARARPHGSQLGAGRTSSYDHPRPVGPSSYSYSSPDSLRSHASSSRKSGRPAGVHLISSFFNGSSSPASSVESEKRRPSLFSSPSAVSMSGSPGAAVGESKVLLRDLVAERTTQMVNRIKVDGYIELSPEDRETWASSKDSDGDDGIFTNEDLQTGAGRTAFAKFALGWAKRELAEGQPRTPAGSARGHNGGRGYFESPRSQDEQVQSPQSKWSMSQDMPSSPYPYSTYDGAHVGVDHDGAVDEQRMSNEPFPWCDPSDPRSFRADSPGSFIKPAIPRAPSALRSRPPSRLSRPLATPQQSTAASTPSPSASRVPGFRTPTSTSASPHESPRGRKASQADRPSAQPARTRTGSVSLSGSRIPADGAPALPTSASRTRSRAASVSRPSGESGGPTVQPPPSAAEIQKQLLEQKKRDQAQREKERIEALQSKLRANKAEKAERDRKEQERKEQEKWEKEQRKQQARLDHLSGLDSLTSSAADGARERKARSQIKNPFRASRSPSVNEPSGDTRRPPGLSRTSTSTRTTVSFLPADWPPPSPLAPKITPDVVALPYLSFTLNGHPVKLLIDSGAQISLIQPKLRTRLGLPYRSAPGHLNGVTGSGACEGICEGYDGQGVELVASGQKGGTKLITKAKMVSGPCGQMSDGILGMPWVVSANAQIQYKADDGVWISFDVERKDRSKERMHQQATGEQEIRRGSFWTANGISPVPDAGVHCVVGMPSPSRSRTLPGRTRVPFPASTPLSPVVKEPPSARLASTQAGRPAPASPPVLTRSRTISDLGRGRVVGVKTFNPGARARAWLGSFDGRR